MFSTSATLLDLCGDTLQPGGQLETPGLVWFESLSYAHQWG